MTTKDNDGQATTQVSVRVPTALVDRLRELADREDRSMSAELRRALERHVRENERTAA